MRPAPASSPASGTRSRPLFEIDPGWLFILAGLALCVAGVLLPAQRDLFHLRTQLDSLRERERLGTERLRFHARFLADLDEADASLTRRLAASQLNVVPAGDVPVVLASSGDAALTDWIDARAALASRSERASPAEWPDTTLTRLATGPQRLWLLGGGVLAVFVGLMLGPTRRSAAGGASEEAIRESAAALREPPQTEQILDDAPAETADSFEHEPFSVQDESCPESSSPENDDVVCEVVTASEFAIAVDESDLEGAANSKIIPPQALSCDCATRQDAASDHPPPPEVGTSGLNT